MGFEIGKIANGVLRNTAQEADLNKNGIIDEDEFLIFNEKALAKVKNKECSDKEFQQTMGLYFGKESTIMSEPGEPSVSLKNGKIDRLFGLYQDDITYYEFKTRDGQTRKVKPSSRYCFGYKYGTLFNAFAKYSTKDDPNLNAEEVQGVIRELSRYTDVNETSGHPQYDIAKKDIVEQLKLASSKNSEGGTAVTVNEQRDILEAWCTDASYNIDDITDEVK